MFISFFKKSVIRLNFILSVGFGVLMGVVFPYYAMLFVSFKSDLLKLIFYIGCIVAGILVGLMAFMITRFTIIRVIKAVSKEVQENENRFYYQKVWAFLIRFICPVAIFFILGYIAWTGNYF